MPNMYCEKCFATTWHKDITISTSRGRMNEERFKCEHCNNIKVYK